MRAAAQMRSRERPTTRAKARCATAAFCARSCSPRMPHVSHLYVQTDPVEWATEPEDVGEGAQQASGTDWLAHTPMNQTKGERGACACYGLES